MVNSNFVSRLRNDYGIEFKDLSLLDEAFTHSSFVNEHPTMHLKNYEKLEFLGDAVLELKISDYLYHHFPDLDEGELSVLRSNIVRTDGFSSFAKKAGFDQAIQLGKGEESSGARSRKTLLEDIFEAFNGALFLDGGLDQVEKFLSQLVYPEIKSGKFTSEPDFKTEFQELVQQNGAVLIEYRLIQEIDGKDSHDFIVDLYVNGKKLTSGRGKSKKAAEQVAAEQAIKDYNK